MTLGELIQHLTEIRLHLGPIADDAEVAIHFISDPGTTNTENDLYSSIDDVQSEWGTDVDGDPSDIRINLIEGDLI